MLTLKSAFKDIYKISIDVTNIKDAKGNIDEITSAIKGLSAEQAVYRMSLAKCSKEDMFFALQQNGVSEATIKAALAQQTNTLATTANTTATQVQTLSEEEWLAQQWLSIGAEEADTVATGANTVAKKANLSVTNLLKVASSKLAAVIKANPVVAITAVALGALLAIKKYYDHVEKVRQQLKETAKEAKSAIDEINSSFKTLSSTTNDIKKRYAELAQGVDNLGKVNQSRGSLSNDDYEEFLDLSNQLAKLFPQLTVGYDDNGNAILNLSGNVDTIVGSLNNLVDVQQKLANQEMLGKLSDVWAGYTIELEEYNKKLQDSQNSLKKYQKLMTEVGSDSEIKIRAGESELMWAAQKAGIYKSEGLFDYGPFVAHYTEAPHNGGKYIDSYTLDIQKLTESEKNALLNALGELGSEYNKAVQMAKGNIASANADMSSYINTWLSGEWNYSKMDSNLQNVVKDVLLNTDWVNSLPSDVDSNSWDEVSNWLQRNFLYAINDIDNEEIEKALVDAFNDNLSIESLREIIGQLTGGEFGFTEDNPLIIFLQAKLVQKEDIRDNLRNSLRQISEYGSGYTDYEELSYLDEYTKDFTQSQADLWLQVTQGAENATDAINRYEEALKNANETDPAAFSDIFSLKDSENTITNLGKISESIDTIQNAYKTLSDAIDEYNETGSLSIDTLQSVIALGDDWLDYLVDENGNLQLDKESLEQLTQARINDMRVQTINNLIDNVSKIETDADANEYLASTNYALVDSYEEVAQAALKSARAKLEDAVASETLSRSNMDAIMEKATADISKINKLFANVDFGSDSIKGSKSSGSKSSSSSSAKSEFEETIDYFERRVNVLSDALSLLETNLDNVTGSFAKNNLIDAELGLTEEKFKNYSDALNMYTQKANEALSKLPSDIAQQVREGAVALTDFIGDGNKDVVDAIKDYESWADKIADCQQELAELKTAIRQLELQKFNSIMEDFTNQFDLRENGKDLISKQIDLLKEAGELIGESFFTAQIEQSKKQLALLEEEKTQLVNQMSSALSSGRVK